MVGLRVWRSTALGRVLMFVYHSQIRLKGLGQSLVLLVFVLNKLMIGGSGIIEGNQWFLSMPVYGGACARCSTVTFVDGRRGTCTKNVWFNKMQNECNLCLVGAVETE